MAYEIKPTDGNAVSPIGTAHPNRGVGYHDAAVDFIKQHPVGTELTAADFDGFAISRQLIKPPSSYDRGSDGWQAFLQRRHQAKINLNKAGTHSRMIEAGVTPFCIMQIGSGAMIVRTPYEAAITTPVGKQVESLVETKKKSLRYLLQSVDYTALPPAEQAQVQNLYETLEDFGARVEFETSRLSHKFERLRAGVLRMVNEGVVKPENGGIKQLIENQMNQEVHVEHEEHETM